MPKIDDLMILQPYWRLYGTTPATAANMILDANGEEVAIQYYPTTTSPITHVDLYLDVSGTVSDTNFDIRVESDSGGAPSGSVLGAACSKFAGPAADGWIGAKALATNTGNLTIGTPVWICLRRVDGGDLSGTDKVQLYRIGNNPSLVIFRHFNGADWTTTSPLNSTPLMVLTHADSTLDGGVGILATTAGSSGYTDIFGNNRQAVKITTAAKITFDGVAVSLLQAGSPSDLTLTIYKGSTAQYGPFTITDINGRNYLSAVVTLDADADYYFVYKQAADGGDDSNDYDMQNYDTTADFLPVSGFSQMYYGTGDDPTAYTAVTDQIPQLALVCGSIEDAFDIPASGGGGGGLPILGGSVVR